MYRLWGSHSILLPVVLSLYSSMYVCMYVCMYVGMYCQCTIYTYIYTYIYIYIYIYINIYLLKNDRCDASHNLPRDEFVVWSTSGPVPLDGVSPWWRIQSILSPAFVFCHPQVSFSKSQVLGQWTSSEPSVQSFLKSQYSRALIHLPSEAHLETNEIPYSTIACEYPHQTETKPLPQSLTLLNMLEMSRDIYTYILPMCIRGKGLCVLNYFNKDRNLLRVVSSQVITH